MTDRVPAVTLTPYPMSAGDHPDGAGVINFVILACVTPRVRFNRLEEGPWKAVFEEILVNALVHRDYFTNAPMRLLIFTDRIEIISPGHLPNHLDAEQIRFGLSNLRNPALASHAFHLLPYRGLGSGIPRAMAAWPDIEFIDDRRGNQFKVMVRRAAKQTPEVSGRVNGGVSVGVNTLLGLISASPGLNATELEARLKKPKRTLERWLRQLKDQQAIEFRGAPKTGGYYPKPKKDNENPGGSP